ncbi:DUF6247 family protein [Allokutzneria multivorans]
MTAANDSFPGSPVPDLPPEAAPFAIRDALIDEDRTDFVGQYQAAMALAATTLDLAPVLDLLRAWQRTAAVTQGMGVAAYRRMMSTVDEIQRTGTSSTAESRDGMHEVLRNRLGSRDGFAGLQDPQTPFSRVFNDDKPLAAGVEGS